MKKNLLLTVIFLVLGADLGWSRVVHQHYPDGKIKSTQIYTKNGAIKGPYKAYWPNGKLKLETIYKHGKPAVTHLWTDKGKRIK